MRRWTSALALVVCAALCACSHGRATPPAALRIIVPLEPATLNPILQHNTLENFVDGLIFDELVTLDGRGRAIPDLAAAVPTVENGGISRDGLTIAYRLRRDVRWQDGAPFTSADVAFTWHAIVDDRNLVLSRQGYDQIASVDTPGPYTVVFHMKRRFAPAVETIFSESAAPYRILPAHLLARDRELNDVPFDADPVGTGPYRLVAWQRGDRMELAANDAYFRGRPHIARIVLLFVPDHGALQTMMRAGDADLAVEISPLDYHVLRNAGLRTLRVAAPLWLGVAFNTARGPLRDVRIRRALSLALDRTRVNASTSYGTARNANADLTPFSWAYDSALQPVPYEPQAARTLLHDASWSGGSLSFVYATGSATGLEAAEEVQQSLAAVGVDVRLRGYVPQRLYAPANEGGVLDAGEYDLALFLWSLGADPDDSALWLCSMAPPNGSNLTRYCSRQMDALQRSAVSSFDRGTRKRTYAQIESLLVRDAPVAFIADVPMLYAFRPGLQNFSPNGISEGWNAADWRI